MPEGKGYATTTYKLKLYTKHMDWLMLTKLYYNQVLDFYYRLLLSQTGILELSNQKLLRQLEILTVGETRKSGREAQYPLPYKAPLYFRRAAINAAIAMVRSQEARNQKNCAKTLNACPVYYQGMYKQFENGRILLKLWTGKSWAWVKYRYQADRRLPEHAKYLSPSIKVNRKTAMLYVPVCQPVQDIRTIKERIRQKEKICAVTFPNNKNLAVLASLDSEGRFIHACFIKGGGELKHRRKYYLGQNKKQERPALSGRSKKKLNCLNEEYAHKVSREIVNYCVRNGIKIIVAPKYGEGFAGNRKRYVPADGFDWIGRRIIRYLDYKAFQAGIAVTQVPPHHIASRCYACGSPIKKYNTGYPANINFYGGRLYRCFQGHSGNTALNSARNLGKYFVEKLGQ